MRITVVGSLNHDTTIVVPRLPEVDETIHATRVATFCGGKGANQAVAAARLGAEVAMVGCVGRDREGEVLVASLREEGAEVTHVSAVEEPTGSAFPIVSPDDVRIIVHAGANGAVTPAPVDASFPSRAAVDALLQSDGQETVP